jgi:hypothetical protein
VLVTDCEHHYKVRTYRANTGSIVICATCNKWVGVIPMERAESATGSAEAS